MTFVSQGSADPLSIMTWEGNGVIPTCNFNYPGEEETLDGTAVAAPHGSLYCRRGDGMPFVTPKLFQTFYKFSDGRGFAKKVIFSATYFKGPDIKNFVCKIGDESVTEVEIFSQNEFVGREHLDDDVLLEMSKCVRSIKVYLIGCDPYLPDEKISVSSRCFDATYPYKIDRNDPVSHHVKGLMVEFEKSENGVGENISAFGSGNFFTESLRTNIEDWIVISETTHGSIRPWWECIYSFLKSVSERPHWFAAENYMTCRAVGPTVFEVSESLHFRYFLAPEESNKYFDTIRELVGKSGRVTIVAPTFRSSIFEAIIRDNPDVDFLFLVDDAFVIASELNQERNFIEPREAREFLKYVDDNANISVRFLQTNHNYKEHDNYSNTVHARSIAFYDEDGAVAYIVGSAHFKDGAFFQNTEQMFILEGDFAKRHAEFTNDLENRSVDRSKIALWSPG